METLSFITVLLFFILSIALLIGLIRPSLVILKGNKTRKNVFKIYGISIILSFIVLMFLPTNPESATSKETKIASSAVEEEHTEEQDVEENTNDKTDGSEETNEENTDLETENKEATNQTKDTSENNNTDKDLNNTDPSIAAIELVADTFFGGLTDDLYVEELAENTYLVTLSADFGSGLLQTVDAYVVENSTITQTLFDESGNETDLWNYIASISDHYEEQDTSTNETESESTTNEKDSSANETLSKSNTGVYYWNDSFDSIYEGELQDGIPHGKGVSYYMDSYTEKKILIYEGEYLKGTRHGMGTSYTLSGFNEIETSGVFYEGESIMFPWNNEFYFVDNEIIFYSDGDFIRQGDSDVSKVKTGKSMTVYYPHGNVYYEGEWKNNHIEGKGAKYYDYHIPRKFSEGKYDEESKLMGKGLLFYINGQVLQEGNYEVSMFGDYGAHGKAIQYYDNGQIKYKGEYKYGSYHDKGKLYYEDGQLWYEGEFDDGQYQGDGKLYYENGELQYKGEFKDGRYHGKGTLYNEEGKVVQKGTFKNGRFDK